MRLLLLFALVCIFYSCGPDEKPGPPNVILVMADDLGWGDTGYNGNPIIKTPHLDQMSREGITFNRFYAAAPVCSPTRASCLTGRHPYRTGVFTANSGILRPEEVTLAELLKAEGYATGHFGKWHLGTFSPESKDSNRGGRPELYNPPTEHGFDTYFSTEAKVPTWDPMLKPTSFEEPESLQFGWNYLEEGQAHQDYGTAYWTPEGRVTENLRGDDSRVIMDRAIPFIEQSVEGERPFLAVIWFHAPHLPVIAGPEYAAMYEDQDFKMQQFAGCVTAMDEQIGRLRARLSEMGAADNTMIWFCSDNGPEGNWQSPGRTSGFRGRKRSLYEGGVRVPGLVVWPAVVQPAVVETPVVTSDYLPTVMEALGTTPNTGNNVLDGVSVLPLLKGEDWQRPKPIAFASRQQFTYHGTGFKLYGPEELYDLQEDPFEATNLATQYPDTLEQYLEAFGDWYQSARSSFEGSEYGTASFGRVQQQYPELSELSDNEADDR